MACDKEGCSCPAAVEGPEMQKKTSLPQCLGSCVSRDGDLKRCELTVDHPGWCQYATGPTSIRAFKPSPIPEDQSCEREGLTAHACAMSDASDKQSTHKDSDGLFVYGTHGRIALEVAGLVRKKQEAYGDSFGKSGAVLKLLYPDGIPVEKLSDALTVTRVVDKLFRIATDRDALGESPWRDIMGYALLSVARGEEIDRRSK